MRFSFLQPPEELPEESRSLLPGPEYSFMLLFAGRPDEAKAHSAAFKGFKMLCDVLLPELRSRSHLYNLIYRHRSNCSLVLLKSAAVLGGATFRLIHDTGASAVLLEVLLLGVDQRQGVCGRGHGTRIVNVLKAILLRHANEQCARPLLLTQADLGLSARAFWARQQLVEGPDAEQAVRDLHAWNKSNIVYDYTVPMMMEVPNKSWQCTMQESVRAQALLDQSDDDDDVEHPTGNSCTRCALCGRADGLSLLLQCDMCSRWCHVSCNLAAAGEAESAPPDDFTCSECAELIPGVQSLLQLSTGSRHDANTRAAPAVREPSQVACDSSASERTNDNSIESSPAACTEVANSHPPQSSSAPPMPRTALHRESIEPELAALQDSSAHVSSPSTSAAQSSSSALQFNDRHQVEETPEAAHRTYSSNSATFRSPFGAPLPRKRPLAAAENATTERTWPQRGLRSETDPPAGSALILQSTHSSRKFGIDTAPSTCASGGLLCRDSILAQWRLLLGSIVHEQRRLHAQRAPPQRQQRAPPQRPPIRNGRGPSTSHGRGGRSEMKTPTAIGKGPYHDESDQPRSADRLGGLRSGPGSDVRDSAHARAVAIWRRIQMEDCNRIHPKVETQSSKPSKVSASAAEDTTAAAAAWKAFDRIVEHHEAQVHESGSHQSSGGSRKSNVQKSRNGGMPTSWQESSTRHVWQAEEAQRLAETWDSRIPAGGQAMPRQVKEVGRDIKRLLDSNLFAPAPTAQPTVLLAVPPPTPEDTLKERKRREDEARDIVRRVHSAIAIDVTQRSPRARLHILPELGSISRSPLMGRNLLRHGILGAMRRLLHSAVDKAVTIRVEDAKLMRLSCFGIIRKLAPEMRASHLRQSKGLGKIVALTMSSQEETRGIRQAAQAAMQAVIGALNRKEAELVPTRDTENVTGCPSVDRFSTQCPDTGGPPLDQSSLQRSGNRVNDRAHPGEIPSSFVAGTAHDRTVGVDQALRCAGDGSIDSTVASCPSQQVYHSATTVHQLHPSNPGIETRSSSPSSSLAGQGYSKASATLGTVSQAVKLAQQENRNDMVKRHRSGSHQVDEETKSLRNACDERSSAQRAESFAARRKNNSLHAFSKTEVAEKVKTLLKDRYRRREISRDEFKSVARLATERAITELSSLGSAASDSVVSHMLHGIVKEILASRQSD